MLRLIYYHRKKTKPQSNYVVENFQSLVKVRTKKLSRTHINLKVLKSKIE